MFRYAVSYLAATAFFAASCFSVSAEDPAVATTTHNEIANTPILNRGHGKKHRALLEEMPFWTQVGNTLNGDQPKAWFGFSIDQSSDGKFIAVSSENFDDEDTNSTSVGKVQVYQRKWIKKSNRVKWLKWGQSIIGWEGGANQGNTVKLSDNGKILAIGSDDTNDDAGHIDVYKWNNIVKEWETYGNRLVGKVPGSEFGWGFDLTPDGETIVCGSYGHGPYSDGMTEIYTLNDGTWELKGNPIIGFHQNSTQDDAYYGWSVAMDEVGERVITSGPFDGINATYYWTGAVKIYDYDEGSGNWTQAGQTLTGSKNGDEFGVSVAMSKDGSTIAIGAGCYYYCDYNDTEDYHEDYYKDYVVTYKWDGEDELWVLSGEIEREAEDVGFGISINLSDDGTKLALATAGKDYGYARIFAYDSDSSIWTKVGQDLVIDEFENGDNGHIVSLSGDGENLVVGAIEGGKKKVGQVKAYKLATDQATSKVAGCVDADKKVVFRLGKKWQKCSLVKKNKNKDRMCERSIIAAMCPLTCGKCFETACEDGPLQWRKGRKRTGCAWVADSPSTRCKGALVLSVCRKTCYTPMYDTFCTDKDLNGEDA